MSEVRKRAFDEDTLADIEEDASSGAVTGAGLSPSPDDGMPVKRVATEEVHRQIADVLVIKVLCPSQIVGAIIGRGGAVLNGFMSATNTKIRISQNNAFFPETVDRVIAITGQPENVTTAFNEVIEKMCEINLSNDAKRLEAGGGSNQYTAPGMQAPPSNSSSSNSLLLRMLIPHAASGVVIGRAGSSIKEISSGTNTFVKLADATDPYQTKERIVSISGSASENIKVAAQRVLAILDANRNVGMFINVTPTYNLPPSQPMPGSHMLPQHPHQHHQAYPSYAQQPGYPPAVPNQLQQPGHPFNVTGGAQSHSHPQASNAMPAIPGSSPTPSMHMISTQISIPDHMVGVIVGKGGIILKSIQGSTGARIKVSQKGDFIAGTTNRSVTIEGTQQQVHYAHSAIMTQLNQHQNQSSTY